MSRTVMTVFGTRPEVIKLAPVVRELENRKAVFRAINVSSSQHTDLLYPFIRLFDLRIDYDLKVMSAGQTPNYVCSRVIAKIDPILAREKPSLVIVQGDTSTALGAALAAFHHGIPIAHVEAGLRSGNRYSPFPEEMNRRLITRLATYHFAATARNRITLLAEGEGDDSVFLTGNPVVDSLKFILEKAREHHSLDTLMDATQGMKRLVLTTHRRESFGAVMARNLKVLRRFVERHSDVALIFPAHPNPEVRRVTGENLVGHPRVYVIAPLEYDEFVTLLASAWLIVSDSGGVQEEAPTLRKPLLVIRENTERPEAIDAGVARLVGGSPTRLEALLEEAYQDRAWSQRVAASTNPFGEGDSGKRIVDILANALTKAKLPLYA